jgi:hypothetical protein
LNHDYNLLIPAFNILSYLTLPKILCRLLSHHDFSIQNSVAVLGWALGVA